MADLGWPASPHSPLRPGAASLGPPGGGGSVLSSRPTVPFPGARGDIEEAGDPVSLHLAGQVRGSSLSTDSGGGGASRNGGRG